MSNSRVLFIISLCSLLFIAFSLNAATYEQLESYVEKGEQPDVDFIEELPSPGNAQQYYLYSKVSRNYSQAIEAIEEAVQKSSGPARKKYLFEWIRLYNLGEPGAAQVIFLKEKINSENYDDGEIWLAGADLARQAGDGKQAKQWYEKAVAHENSKPRALLALAEISLENDNTDETSELLERYMAIESRESSPEYWLLKGELFEKKSADSEAYVAYSHVIRHYPESLLLPLAEDKISRLPMPEELVAGGKTEPGYDRVDKPEVRTGDGPYWVQVGSFTRRSQAEALAKRLERELNFQALIRTATVSGQRYFRVRVGGFENRNKAIEKLENIREHGHDGFIARD